VDTLTIDPAKLTLPEADRKADPEWTALTNYLRAAAEAGEVVRLTARQELLSPAEVASRMNMSRSTIARKIAAGEIKAVMVGSHHRVPLREFERFRDEVMGAMIADISDELEADLYGE